MSVFSFVEPRLGAVCYKEMKQSLFPLSSTDYGYKVDQVLQWLCRTVRFYGTANKRLDPLMR